MTREQAVLAIRIRPLIQAVIRYGNKHNRIDIEITGLEKWNNNNDPHLPKADGSFEVEGHAWTDIYAYYDLRLWHPKDLWIYLKGCYRWLKELYKDRSWSYSKELMPFNPNGRQAWVWVLETLDTFRRDTIEEMAFNQIEEEMGKFPLEDRHKSKKWSKAQHERIIHISESYTMQDARDHLASSDHYVELGHGMFVSVADPTCIIMDSAVFPPIMKSGYSNAQIRLILSVYLRRITNRSYLVLERNKA